MPFPGVPFGPFNKGQMTIFHVGSHQLRESLRESLREWWFSYCPSREMPFREWNFVFRESVSTLLFQPQTLSFLGGRHLVETLGRVSFESILVGFWSLWIEDDRKLTKN